MRPRHLEVILAAGLVVYASGCATTRDDAHATNPAAKELFPLGKLAINLPSFRSLEELKTWGKPRDTTERFYLFERGEDKVAIVMATWGSGDSWNAVFVYAYDKLRDMWVARSLWNTEARGVRATFAKRSGMIDVRSGGGVQIFQANISALAARRTREW